MVQADTHDYVIQAAGKTFSGSILLDLNRTYVNNPNQANQSETATEQSAINTFMTALSTLFTTVRGIGDVNVVIRRTADKTKKTP